MITYVLYQTRSAKDIVHGTIAAAAVINEIIAVFVARQGFKPAGEVGKTKTVTE